MTLKYNYHFSALATNTRPFCNKDYTNNTIYKHGLPRPLKIYRKSRVKPVHHFTDTRATSTTLNQLMDTPGQNMAFNNKNDLGKQAFNYIQAVTMLHDGTCCHDTADQTKALKRVRRLCNTSPNYSTNFNEYLEKRCNSFKQKSFHFSKHKNNNDFEKPGAPNTYHNQYVGNCNNCSNTTCHCHNVIYKPSNYQFASQGAVSSSLRTTKKTLNTIETGLFLDTFCNKTQF